MAFDYKKEYKEFYLPPKKPEILEIPEMNYVAVRGKGDPNEPEGEYKAAIGILYAISFTIKMSYKGAHKIDGYFSYVVPPLEGLWWQENVNGIDYSHKEDFQWISMIRLPDFVGREDFDWAVREATEKKKKDFSKAKFFTYREGICVQCMHVGSYDKEPETIGMMDGYAEENGYTADCHVDCSINCPTDIPLDCPVGFSGRRFHHEIYLSDPRRAAEDKLRTVIRHPLRKRENT